MFRTCFAWFLLTLSMVPFGQCGALGQTLAGPAIFDALPDGVNVTHWLSAQDGTSMVTADFTAIRSAGFHDVRLTVDPVPLLKMPVGVDGLNASAEHALDAAIAEISGAKLNIVLVVFPDSNYKCQLNHHYDVTFKCTPSNDNPGKDKAVSDAQEAFVGLWTHLATHIAQHYAKTEVFLEILNEPQVEDAGLDEWAKLEGKVIAAIAAAAPGYTIIATPGGFAGIEDLLKFTPPPSGGAQVVYTFHFYWPSEFTQQSAEPEGGYVYPSPERNPSPPLSNLPLNEQFHLNEYSLYK